MRDIKRQAGANFPLAALDSAVTALAEKLYFSLEHHDPSGAPGWNLLPSIERHYYESVVEDLLVYGDLLARALALQLPDHDGVGRAVETRKKTDCNDQEPPV